MAKKHRPVTRGGRKRQVKPKGSACQKKAYRAHMKTISASLDPDKGAMMRGAYMGSKCNKLESERRPKHGGKVHWTPLGHKRNREEENEQA